VVINPAKRGSMKELKEMSINVLLVNHRITGRHENRYKAEILRRDAEYVCPSWADEFYKEWCGMMIAKQYPKKEEAKPEAKAKPKFKKIAGGKR